jgi:hypothetical protein
VTEPGDPVMIVVGDGAIALDTAQELRALQGHRAVVLSGTGIPTLPAR